MSTQNSDPTRVATFMHALRELSDPRDNRGKRHELAWVLGSVALAILAGRTKVSSIQRYIDNKIDWLRDLTQMPNAKPISRAHLPRLLAWVNWDEFNQIIEQHFGVRVVLNEVQEWVAMDGKTLRGTTSVDDKQGEKTLLAVTHRSRTILAQREMGGPKSGEVPAVRELLQDTGLEKAQVTLDALHCNPTTTGQIHRAGGTYLIQVKENQPELLAQLQHVAARATPLATHHTANKDHGRLETRDATFFTLDGVAVAERWADSHLQTLIVMDRHTVELAKQKTTQETSYYVTNRPVAQDQCAVQDDLAAAIRGHWGVESDNWIRDVTFNEDQVKTQDGNQAQVMASLRTLAMRLFRKADIGNFQAAVEKFTDCPSIFETFLLQVGFL